MATCKVLRITNGYKKSGDECGDPAPHELDGRFLCWVHWRAALAMRPLTFVDGSEFNSSSVAGAVTP